MQKHGIDSDLIPFQKLTKVDHKPTYNVQKNKTSRR